MSSKRRADKYLTHDNWDQEEVSEEAGKFEPASKDILMKRTFKKAKRRIAQPGEGSSVFSGFAGLTATKSQTTSNGFKGFKLQSDTKGFTLPPKASDSAPSTAFASKSKEEPISSNPQTVQVKEDKEAMDEKKVAPADGDGGSLNSKSYEYNRHVTALNKSVSKWISEHVEKNPICDLSPIFRDYQKHFDSIEEKFAGSSSSQSDTSQDADDEKHDSTQSSKPDLSQSSKPNTPPKNPFGSSVASGISTHSPFKGFGIDQDKTVATTNSTNSPFKGFGNIGGLQDNSKTSATSIKVHGFSFASKSVAGVPSLPNTESDPQKSSAAEEEEYVPPKPDSNIVEEKDAFYTKKCKLFYMKDGAYADKGVGHLHLKTVSNKTQLIVRADTSLGNVLLNIVINSAMPVAKQGKNNVVISCVPNPPIDEANSDKVIPMLVKVKTSDDADELLEILNKKKQECE